MYDVIVIGGGPAGVTAALRARELGAKVALVERANLGGTCTNDGCVPTRVLAHAARLIREAEQFALYGLEAPRPTFDFARLLERTQQVVYEVHEKKQLLNHLQEVGITTYIDAQSAEFTDPHTIQLGTGETLEGAKFIICAGGRARRLDFPGAEHTLTHSDVWRLKAQPRSVAVIGGGATGCQIASVMAAFGSEVTLLDVAPRLLPPEDATVAECITDEFRSRGIGIATNIGGIERIDRDEDGLLHIVVKNANEVTQHPVEAVIVSVGWPGNVDRLNLGAAGVETAGAYIKVDDQLRTNVPHIFAAGDITGRMLLVQSGGHQARIAAENAVLLSDREDENRLVPHGGFTDPEYGGVGPTEEQARERYGAEHVTVATVPYSDLDRAVIDARTVGFCKLVVDRDSQQVIGAHVVGEQAVEVVQMVAAGIAGGLTIQQFAELEYAYPTFAAIVGLAARQLVRELGIVPLRTEWRMLRKQRPAEWERSDQ